MTSITPDESRSIAGVVEHVTPDHAGFSFAMTFRATNDLADLGDFREIWQFSKYVLGECARDGAIFVGSF